MKIWQLSTKANNYVKRQTFLTAQFSLAQCVCLCLRLSCRILHHEKKNRPFWDKQKLFFTTWFFSCWFWREVDLWLCLPVPGKNKVGGGWWGGGVEAVIWFSHTLKGPLFVSCASEIGWWVLLESGRGETICIHLLYLNGTEEEPREKVELRT